MRETIWVWYHRLGDAYVMAYVKANNVMTARQRAVRAINDRGEGPVTLAQLQLLERVDDQGEDDDVYNSAEKYV